MVASSRNRAINHRTAGDVRQSLFAVKVLVLARFDQKLTLEDLADAACLPASSLSRYFHRAYALSPMRWVWLFRAFVAAEMFGLTPKRSIADVARLCGYGSAAHFTRSFTQALGETPSRYRARCLRLSFEGPRAFALPRSIDAQDARGDLLARALARLEGVTEARHHAVREASYSKPSHSSRKDVTRETSPTA